MAWWDSDDDDMNGNVVYGGDIDQSVTETVVYGNSSSKKVKGATYSYGRDMYIDGDKVPKKKGKK